MLVLDERVGPHVAAAAAHAEQRQLASERHPGLEEQRHLTGAERGEGRVGLAGLVDPGLALAVVAEPAGLQERRHADLGQRRVERGLVVDRGERRGADAELPEQALLGEPVLGRRQRLGAGVDLGAGLLQRRDGAGWDVLELVGHDVARGGQSAQRVRVVVGRLQQRGDLPTAGLGRRVEQGAADVERVPGEGQHPPELAAADDPDPHRVGGGGCRGSGSCRTASVRSAR